MLDMVNHNLKSGVLKCPIFMWKTTVYLSAPYNLYNAIVINKILLLFYRNIKRKKEKET